MALGLTGANLQAYWDKVTSAAETGAQMVAPLLPDRYQVQPGETPPTSTPQPVGRQDYKPPAATTAPPPPPPVKEESQHTFARMRELAGIAKKTS
jgi:hypothetical protein